MKRSRSESPVASSSSSDDSSNDDSSTISSHDSSESEKHTPNCDYVKGNNRNSSISSKQSSSTSSSNSSSKRTASCISTGQTKGSTHSSGKSSQHNLQSASKKINNGHPTHASYEKGLKTAFPNKKQVIEVIDSSTSEYSPSDDDDATESSTSSESENEPRHPIKHVQKRAKVDMSDYAAIKEAKKETTCRKKQSSGKRGSDGKEATRYSRGKYSYHRSIKISPVTDLNFELIQTKMQLSL